MKNTGNDQSIAIVFGGDGYIGHNLIARLVSLNLFDEIYVYDLKITQSFTSSYSNPRVKHIQGDVRKKITIPIKNPNPISSWIFNFAAIHREPGHDFREYFDTNIPGAENINEFARKTGIKNLFFTSSIAPYGRSLEQRNENSPLYPETAYGISKALAEKIHQEWLAEDTNRRLIIVRPSVIFGPNDPGNVYRMIKSLKRGTFILPNGGKIIKSYGYIYGLIESMLFTMAKNKRIIIYNYAENPVVPLKEMVRISKEELDYNKPTIKMSVRILAVLAFFIQKANRILGRKSDIHPVRVRKAGFPTNIKPEYLIENKFEFKYDFRNALKHWRSVNPEDFN
ncbi:MAG: NAD(P)-dependent oxidoreductase [Eudoraea sp.]|nr:NAD(P)-dependent oxidoreductase [Eudoraea sp.]